MERVKSLFFLPYSPKGGGGLGGISWLAIISASHACAKLPPENFVETKTNRCFWGPRPQALEEHSYNSKSYTTTRWSLLQLKSGPYHNRSQKTQNRTLLQPEQRIISLPRDAVGMLHLECRAWSAAGGVLLEWCWRRDLGMLLEG